MCKMIKEILSVLNPCGKRKRYLSIDVPPYLLNIVWSGEALCVSYTEHRFTPKREHIYTPKKFAYANGNNTTETIDIPNGDKSDAKYFVVDNKVYFNCTNVTSLIVNGETLI